MIPESIRSLLPGSLRMYEGRVSIHLPLIGPNFPWNESGKKGHGRACKTTQEGSHNNMGKIREGLRVCASFVVPAVLILICLCLLCGCIETGSVNDLQNTQKPDTVPYMQDSPRHEAVTPYATPGYQDQNSIQSVNHFTQPSQGTEGGVVTYTDPIPPTISSNMSRRNLDQTSEFSPSPLDYPAAPFFHETYDLSWNNVALLAHPSSPPFIIEYTVKSATKNPYDGRVLLTVRNNETLQVVAEEGYNGEYSSDPVKRIIIRKEGDYHLNLYGYRAIVDLVLLEGIPEGQVIPYDTLLPRDTLQVSPSSEGNTGHSTAASRAVILNEEAVALLESGNLTGAIATFDLALAADSQYTPARVNRGIVLLSLGKEQEALLSFEITLDRDPGNTHAWTYRGDTLEAMGKHDEAADSYRQALAINPSLDTVWEKLGNALAEEGRWNDALDAWAHASDLRPGDVVLEEKIRSAAAEHAVLPDIFLYIIAGGGCAVVAAVILLVLRKKKGAPGSLINPGNNTGGSGTGSDEGNAATPKKKAAFSLKKSAKPGKEGKMSFLSQIHGTKTTPENNQKKTRKDSTGSRGVFSRISGSLSRKKASGCGVEPVAGKGTLTDDPAAMEMEGEELFSSRTSPETREDTGSPEQIASGFGRVLSGTAVEPSGFRGIAYYAMGCYEKALVEFESEITEGRESSGVFILKAAVLQHQGRIGEALESCISALELEPGSFEGQKRCGDLLAASGKSTEALHAYDRALSTNPYSADVWISRASLLLSNDRGHEALQSCERALGIEPLSSTVLFQKSRILASLGSYEDALKTVDTAVSRDGTDPSLFTCRARILRKLGRNEEALQSYDIALTIHPEQPRVWAEMAVLFHELQKYHEEAVACERASALDPGNRQYLIAWGLALHSNREYLASARIWVRILNADPLDGPSWFQLGMALSSAEKFEDALSALDRAVKADPQNRPAWTFRGHVLARLKRYREAYDSYQKVLDIDPDDSESRRGQKMLRRLVDKPEDRESSGQGPKEISGDGPVHTAGTSDYLFQLRNSHDQIISQDTGVVHSMGRPDIHSLPPGKGWKDNDKDRREDLP